MEMRVDPRLFHEFHFKIAIPLRLPVTSRKVIEEFVDIDVNAEAISNIIVRNQYVEYMLLQEIKSLGLKENTPGLRAAIALVGMQKVRDYVCALQMMRNVSRKHPGMTKEGKSDFRPSDYLQYALKTEEFVTVRQMQYTDMAYAAGMMFDLMVLVGRELFKAAKPYEDYVAEVYKQGLKAARLGSEIVKSFKSFSFTRYVFAGCLVHDIGRLAMDLLYPAGTPASYQAFRGEVTKKPVSRHVMYFTERARFGLTHDYYGSQLAYYYSIFRPLEKVLLFHHDPFLIKNSKKDVYNLAALIALSANMATNFRAPKDTNDPIYRAWLTPELRDFRVDPQLLRMIMLKLGRESF